MSSQLTNFLKRQNLTLKQQNKQLKTLLQLNRQALKVATRPKQGQTNFIPLISLLYQQNSKLHKKINQLTVQLETGMCQALISEQIAFASTEQQKYLTNELKDKLIRIRKELEAREKKIVELTKHQSEKKGQPGPETRVIEVCDMSSVTKRFKDEINQLRNEIQQKRQQVAKYKDQKQQLLKLNLILTKQINQYKIITSHQSTSSNDITSGDLSKFMSYQRKIIEDQDDPQSQQDEYKDSQEEHSSEPEHEESIEQPSKVSKISKLEISKVPKLQLGKAKEIQELIVQKINNQDNKKKGVVKEEKFKKIEAEVGTLRKKVGAVMLEKIEIEKQNSFLKKFVKELQARNTILTQSQLKKEDEQINTSVRYMEKSRQRNGDTETLLDICRDVTLNPVLRKVLNGSMDLPYNCRLKSYDI